MSVTINTAEYTAVQNGSGVTRYITGPDVCETVRQFGAENYTPNGWNKPLTVELEQHELDRLHHWLREGAYQDKPGFTGSPHRGYERTFDGYAIGVSADRSRRQFKAYYRPRTNGNG